MVVHDLETVYTFSLVAHAWMITDGESTKCPGWRHHKCSSSLSMQVQIPSG